MRFRPPGLHRVRSTSGAPGRKRRPVLRAAAAASSAVPFGPMHAPLMLSVSGARGIVGATMTPAVATAFAAAFGSTLASRRGTPTVCIGRDSRPSGDMVVRAAAAGLLAVGCEVIELGIVTTPTVGLMVDRLACDGGMVATASHNPIEWNGLKCLEHRGVAPPAERAALIIDRCRSYLHDGKLPLVNVHGMAGARQDDRGPALHVDAVLRLVDAERIRRRAFRVVLDSVNGAGGPAGRALLERLGCVVEHLNGEPSGRFAHTPEPIESNLGDLVSAVLAAKPGVACGFAQDPDADRLAIVDERGTYIGEEYTLVLAAKRLLDRLNGRTNGVTLAANLSTSRMLDDLAARYDGVRVLRTAVGEANVAAAMRGHSALVGGEGNGGVIVPAVCWVRDSLSAMALTLDLLAAEERPLSQVVAALPRYEMIKHKIELGAMGGQQAVAPALERVAKAFADQRLDATDGVRVDFADGWVHLRPSNTEPIVRLIAEAPGRERAWEIIDEVAVAAGLK